MAKKKKVGIKLKKEFKKLAVSIGKSYKIGFFEPKIATYMVYNEYGTRTIPERPFFRAALRKSRAQMKIEARRGARNRGRTSLLKASRALKEQIQLSMADWSEPANTPSTIARKGFNDPLIWTGEAYDSVKVKRNRNRKPKGLNKIR